MALLKEKTLNNGLTVSYWRIVNLKSIAKGNAEYHLGGFIDKDASDTYGDQAILAMENGHLPITKSDFISANPYEKAYELIKESKLDQDGNEMNWFADSEDV